MRRTLFEMYGAGAGPSAGAPLGAPPPADAPDVVADPPGPFDGEIRAVGDVFREQAGFMVRCGFDAFEPSDGSTPDIWAHAVSRHRHVYQRAADARAPAFLEREGG